MNLDTVKDIARGWEYLRPLYNLILIAVVLVFLVMAATEFGASRMENNLRLIQLPWLAIATLCAVGAVGANICYFAGHVAQLFLHWIGMRSVWIRTLLFSIGTLLSIPVALFYLRVGTGL